MLLATNTLPGLILIRHCGGQGVGQNLGAFFQKVHHGPSGGSHGKRANQEDDTDENQHEGNDQLLRQP